METAEPIAFPGATFDPLEADLREIEAAIRLVERGTARAVTIVGLRRPEAVAGIGAALAQQAHVAFSLSGEPGGRRIVTVSRIAVAVGEDPG
jgi:hypothetical protein